MEFNTEFSQFSMPGAFIYRLRFKWATAIKSMGAIQTVDMGRPDEQLCDRNF
jgi:hypothetical protein